MDSHYEAAAVLPIACLVAGAFAIYMVARLITRRNEVLAVFTASTFALAGFFSLPMWRRGLAVSDLSLRLTSWLSDAEMTTSALRLRTEPAALVLATIALGLGFVVSIYSGRYLALDKRYETYYPLLCLLVAGLLGMLYSTDLFTLYLFCELMNVACYILVSFRRRTDTAIEAGLKYLIMGSVGTIIFLMGIAFVYRDTGNLGLDGYAGLPKGLWSNLGLALFFVGLGIKSALVPLHTWLPDAHGRAPSSISAILSGIVVQSNLYVLLKVVLCLGMAHEALGTALILLALPSMIVGNLLALVQRHGKRLLAYSTIANMGYLLLAFGVGLRYSSVEGLQAALFLLWVHALMKGLAFLSKGVCHFYENATLITELRGTAQRMPVVAGSFALSLGSLASIPPLAGFAAKWAILVAILQAPDGLAWLALIIMLLTSVLAVAYYLPMIVTLFSALPQRPRRVRVSLWMVVPLLALAAALLVTSLVPNVFLAWFEQGSRYLAQLGGS